jgi:ankyrin repeat protein
MTSFPLEVLERIFLYSSRDDVRKWKTIVPTRAYLCKRDKNLELAAIRGNLLGVKYYSKRLAQELPNGLKLSALVGHFETVQYLIETHFEKVAEMIPDAIYHAYKSGHYEIVHYLIDIDPESHKDCFYMSIRDENEEMLAYFVDRKYGDINYARRAAALQLNSTMLHVLFRNDVPLDLEGESVLQYCIKIPDLPLFLRIMELGLDFNAHLKCLCIDSAVAGNLDIWKLIVQSNQEWREPYGEKSFQLAIWHGHANLVQFLYENNAARDPTLGRTALLNAAASGNIEVLQYLEDVGADEVTNRMLLVVNAANRGHLGMVQYLIHSGVGIDSVPVQMDIIRTVCHRGHLDVLQFLLYNGLTIPISRYAQAALVECAKGGQVATLKLLVEEFDLDVNAFGPIALREAAAHGHVDMVAFLVEKGADLAQYGEEVVLLSARKRKINVAQYLIDVGVPMDYYSARRKVLDAVAQRSIFPIVFFADLALPPVRIPVVEKVIYECATNGDADTMATLLQWIPHESLLLHGAGALGALHGHMDVVIQALRFGANKGDIIESLRSVSKRYGDTPLRVEDVMALPDDLMILDENDL